MLLVSLLMVNRISAFVWLTCYTFACYG